MKVNNVTNTISAINSYNMDLLSFINVMTSDQFYVNYYQKEYARFYPLISNDVKTGISALITTAGSANIAPFFTTIVSSLDNYNNRNVKEMLLEYDIIDSNMQKSPYYSLYSEYIKMLPHIAPLIIQLISELEENGFRAFWENEKLPLIEKRCEEVAELFMKFDINQYITKYKKLKSDEIIIYVCCFSKPHATKLCGNALVVDYIYPDRIIANNVIHELFHPPYNNEEVKELTDELAKKEFVINAHKNQNPNYAYGSMIMFIEENFVEALAVNAVVMLGLEENPYKYFEKHDDGSHVISPHFYTYLQENDIKDGETFTEYLGRFIIHLKSQL